MAPEDQGSQPDAPGGTGLAQEEGHAPPTTQPVIQDLAALALQPSRCLGDLILGPEASHWSSLLVRDHLDSGSLLSLSHTCTAARDLVLVTAEHATIQLFITTQHPNMAKLRHLNKDMQIRGKLPTKLGLTGTHPCQLAYLLGLLEEGTAGLDEMTVRSAVADVLPCTFLATLAVSCPNLRVLHVLNVIDELPDLHLFPNLKELTLKGRYLKPEALRRVYRSTVPYAMQLTLLAMPDVHPLNPLADPFPVISDLLHPPHVYAHLHTLNIQACFNDAALGLVLQGVPSLRELLVLEIELSTDDHMQAKPQWQRLQFRDLTLSSLVRMAKFWPAGMEVVWGAKSQGALRGCGARITCDTAPSVEVMAACLRGVRFQACQGLAFVHVDVSRTAAAAAAAVLVDVDEQPAALRAGLTLVRACNTAQASDHRHISLGSCTMSGEVMQELQGMPRWKECHLWEPDLHLTWLPDNGLYRPLLLLLPDSYRTVRINASLLTFQQVQSICLGSVRGRTPLTPLRIEVVDWSPDLIQAIRAQLRLAATSDVVVVPFGDAAAYSDEDDVGDDIHNGGG